MKISEELIMAYSYSELISSKSVKVLRDALQQAVAENLKMEFQKEYYDAQERFPRIRYTNFCNDPRHDFITRDHWLAEADKLLRGEK